MTLEEKARKILEEPYTLILTPEKESGGFSARVMEFSGCFAEGETAREALMRLQDAAESWVMACLDTGRYIPEPMGHKEYSGKILLRMPRTLHQRCVEYAKAEGVSLNQFVTMALSEAVALKKERK